MKTSVTKASVAGSDWADRKKQTRDHFGQGKHSVKMP